MSFPEDGTPTTETSEANARTATLSRSGLSLSAACIAEPGQPTELVLDGPALNERLSMLAGTLGVIGAVVTAPTLPGASCGLIEGQKAVGDAAVHVRAKFCYAPGALFIVEASSDGSSGAEQAALAAINSVTSR
jgi:hypothetical protein